MEVSYICLQGISQLFQINDEPFHGNMRHAFDGAKLFISNTCCRLRPGVRISHTRLERAWSSSAGSLTATSIQNKQFCLVKNKAHITVEGFILTRVKTTSMISILLKVMLKTKVHKNWCYMTFLFIPEHFTSSTLTELLVLLYEGKQENFYLELDLNLQPPVHCTGALPTWAIQPCVGGLKSFCWLC